MQRGDLWWANLPCPVVSEPGFRRPVIVVQSDFFNQSRLATTLVVSLTSNLVLAGLPGNVLVRAHESGLPKDSVINVTQVMTIDRSRLVEFVGSLPEATVAAVDKGLETVLSL